MLPDPPHWFKQRQCKAEPVGSDNLLKLSGPNLGEAFIRIEPANGRWIAALRLTADGQDVGKSATDYRNPAEAWQAAFELYRTQLIV